MCQARILISVLIFAFKLWYLSSQSCDVNNLGVSFRELEYPNGNWNFRKVSGCISDESFPGQKIVHLWIQRAYTPILEKKIIGDMKYLEEIYIDKSHVEIIEPGAFFNLPQLNKMSISNNSIINISRGVFDVLPSLQKLHISLSKVSYIEERAFANLPNLKEFGLAQNNLNYMKREWFTNTSNIEYISVFGNSIRKIPLGMFHGWRKLRSLALHSNAISVIEGELFKDNPIRINTVALHHNRLESIDPDTFPDSVYIAKLAISGNLLNYVPEIFLRKIHVGDIAIYGNPFTCPCLEKINRILMEKGVTVDDSTKTYAGACKGEHVPICGVPLSHSKTCVDAVDIKLTRRFLTYLKKIRYDTVRDPVGQQCAMFDNFK